MISGSDARAGAAQQQRLSHAHIIAFHDVIQRGSELCLCLEYAAGGTLAQLIQKGERLSPARVKSVMLQLCSALTHMHEDDPVILHRDLKPDNVLLSRAGDKGAAKICDLGLACVVMTGASARQRMEWRCRNWRVTTAQPA